MPSARKALEAAGLKTYHAENEVVKLTKEGAPKKDIAAAKRAVKAAKKAEAEALKALDEENDRLLGRPAAPTKEVKKSRKGGRKTRRGTRRTRRV